MRPAKSDEVSALLIGVLAKSLSGPCVNETPPEKGITFPFYLNSLLFPFSSYTFNSLRSYSKMSSVARAIRPFASRVLAQKPIAPICQASPAFRFPRGTRSFSQSPLAQLKKYTESHEWIELADGGKTAKIGITDYAAHSLGDVVYVELPEEGLDVAAGEPVGAVESVKSASDVLSPVAGKVIGGNSLLEDKAKTINESPEGEGWIAEIEVADAAELDALLDEAAYKQTIDA
ncbi:unnamed protein product [Penicillium salamii]|nr:unnamed protein product [Penicillium salamii]